MRTLEPCTLLALRRADLLESIGEDRQTGQRVLELVRMHDRPRRVGPGLPRDIDRSTLWQRAVAAIRRVME